MCSAYRLVNAWWGAWEAYAPARVLYSPSRYLADSPACHPTVLTTQVACTVAFLAMDAAGYITGQVVGVDGGMMQEGFRYTGEL